MMFKSPKVSPRTSKSEKIAPSGSPLKYSAEQHRIITADDGSVFELMHHINEIELRDVLARNPGLLAQNIVNAYEPDKYPYKPYKIGFGQGGFAKTRLAKRINPDSTYDYFVERKVLSESRLKRRHSGKEFAERTNVLRTSQNELSASGRLTACRYTMTSITSALNLNTKGKKQLYQFMPIAELGDLSNMDHILATSGLLAPDKHNKRYEYITAVSNFMIRAIMELHKKGLYHRDIKPDNFLVGNDGIPLIADFGTLAYQLDEENLATVSKPTSEKYQPKGSLLASIKDEKLQFSIHDQWSLAISILEMHGIKLLHPPHHELSIKCAPRNPLFSKIQPHLRHFILSALNPDVNNLTAIHEIAILPDDIEAETRLLLNIYETMCACAVTSNEMFFKMQGKDHLSHTDNNSSSEAEANYFENEAGKIINSLYVQDSTVSYAGYSRLFAPTTHSNSKLNPPSPVPEEKSEELSGEYSIHSR